MSQHSWLECSHSHRLYMTSGADADTDAAQLPGDGSEVAQRPEDRVPQVCGVFTADDDWRGTVAEAGVVQAGNTLPAVPSGDLGLHAAERRVRRALPARGRCRSCRGDRVGWDAELAAKSAELTSGDHPRDVAGS